VTQKDKKAHTGEMRKRHEQIIRSGVLGKIGSEGRLAFAVALCWADYGSCQFRMSARGAAKVAGVAVTTMRRGISQLVAAGVLEVGAAEPGRRQKYRFSVPRAHEACAPPDTLCVRPLTRGVRAAHTGGARGAHEACAQRAQGVSSFPQCSSRVPQGTLKGTLNG